MNTLTVPILLINQALSPDPAAAIASLRDLGPPGLDAIVEHGQPGPALRTAIDLVGAQRDNVCGLYWYTDLDRARDAARAQAKPIVSLRLLGRLDEDLSCANSRFLRTAIYANEQIATVLKDRFILHWQSVRPVPRITIDFGDGRRIERTITGNSLHYLLPLPPQYPRVVRRRRDRPVAAADTADLRRTVPEPRRGPVAGPAARRDLCRAREERRHRPIIPAACGRKPAGVKFGLGKRPGDR